MNRDVFCNLKQLKQLTINNCSGINFTASVLESIERIDVENSVVHNISSILDPLPSMLTIIHFEDVQSQQSSKLTLRSSGESESNVQNVTLVQCSLNSVVVQNLLLLLSLSLSQNSLSESTVQLVNLPRLQLLVLTHNAFDAVSESFLKFGSSLEVIDLSHNRISYLHPSAFDVALSLRLVNLSHNLLLNMQNIKPHPRLERIEVDSNPWDCSWLNHCRLLNPTLFNIFRYDKRYDVLTVWGLPCLLQAATPPTDPNFPPLQSERNLSTTALPLLSTSLTARDTVTEKSTSFWYEVPVGGDSNAMPLNHIYEEIRDAEAQRDIYDALNFQRDKQQQPEAASSS
uniref:Uncharacterized protein n=1 Tax=Anopheles maculatus TaxID=74869 RepID=A0A182TC07_9DIPT